LSFRIRHREFVATVDSDTSYAYDLQVMDDTTFPWVANIARYFDQYRFHRLSFCLVSSLSASTSGNVAIAYDPNSSDTPPSDMASLLQMAYQRNGAIWNTEYTLPIPASQLVRSPGPVRFTHVSVDNDPLLASLGQVLILSATPSASPLVSCMNLFVDYDLELINPQPVVGSLGVPPDTLPSLSLTKRDGTTGMPFYGNLFTTAQVNELKAYLGSTLGIDVSTSSQNVEYVGAEPAYNPVLLDFKWPGDYLVELSDWLTDHHTAHGANQHPALLNWTKDVTISDLYETGLGGNTDNEYLQTAIPNEPAYGSTVRFIASIADGLVHDWNVSEDATYASAQKVARIALGLWDSLDGTPSDITQDSNYSTTLKTSLSLIKGIRRLSGFSLSSCPIAPGIHRRALTLSKQPGNSCSQQQTTTTTGMRLLANPVR